MTAESSIKAFRTLSLTLLVLLVTSCHLHVRHESLRRDYALARSLYLSRYLLDPGYLSGFADVRLAGDAVSAGYGPILQAMQTRSEQALLFDLIPPELLTKTEYLRAMIRIPAGQFLGVQIDDATRKATPESSGGRVSFSLPRVYAMAGEKKCSLYRVGVSVDVEPASWVYATDCLGCLEGIKGNAESFRWSILADDPIGAPLDSKGLDAGIRYVSTKWGISDNDIDRAFLQLQTKRISNEVTVPFLTISILESTAFVMLLLLALAHVILLSSVSRRLPPKSPPVDTEHWVLLDSVFWGAHRPKHKLAAVLEFAFGSMFYVAVLSTPFVIAYSCLVLIWEGEIPLILFPLICVVVLAVAFPTAHIVASIAAMLRGVNRRSKGKS